jgi:L-iditol 2-dehydrogenase
MAAVLAKLSGAFKVIVLGAPAHRLAIAGDFGVEAVIDISAAEPEARIQQVKDLTHGRGSDVTIEATGAPPAVKEGMEMTRDGGVYVVVGQYTDAGEVRINPHLDINRKHLDIRGTWGSEFRHFYLAARLNDRYGEAYPWEKIISREYPLDQAGKALDDVRNLRVMKAVINPWT